MRHCTAISPCGQTASAEPSQQGLTRDTVPLDLSCPPQDETRWDRCRARGRLFPAAGPGEVRELRRNGDVPQTGISVPDPGVWLLRLHGQDGDEQRDASVSDEHVNGRRRRLACGVRDADGDTVSTVRIRRGTPPLRDRRRAGAPEPFLSVIDEYEVSQRPGGEARGGDLHWCRATHGLIRRQRDCHLLRRRRRWRLAYPRADDDLLRPCGGTLVRCLQAEVCVRVRHAVGTKSTRGEPRERAIDDRGFGVAGYRTVGQGVTDRRTVVAEGLGIEVR
jgi:hypothetical protein